MFAHASWRMQHAANFLARSLEPLCEHLTACLLFSRQPAHTMHALAHVDDVESANAQHTAAPCSDMARTALRGEAAVTLAALAAGTEDSHTRKRARFEEEALLRLENSRRILSRRPSASPERPQSCTFRPISPLPLSTVEPLTSVTPSASVARGRRFFANADLSPTSAGPAPPPLGRSASLMAAAAALLDTARCGTRRRLQMPPESTQRVHSASSASLEQLQRLAAAFVLCPRPNQYEMARLAHHLGLAQPTLEMWFERRRALQEWVGQHSPPLQPADVAKWLHGQAEAAAIPQP